MKKEKSYMYTFIIFIKIFKRKIYYSTKHVGFPHKIKVRGFEFDLRWKYPNTKYWEKTHVNIIKIVYCDCMGEANPDTFGLNSCTIKKHTSKINDLRSSLNSKEMLQNFLYLYKKKTQVIFFIFHLEHFWVLPYINASFYVDIDQAFIRET